MNDIIVKYQKNKEKYPQMTIEDFINHSIEACLKNKGNSPNDKLEIKLKNLKKILNVFKTKIAVNELYPSTGSAAEIPKVKDITFSRLKLNIESVEEYRERRKKEIIEKKEIY